MNILYATSFKNEQTAATGVPVRIKSNANPTYNGVQATGWLAGVQANVQLTAIPEVTPSKRYLCYSLKIEPRGNLGYFDNLNVFGCLLKPYINVLYQQLNLTILQDTQAGTGRVYVNGRYAGPVEAIQPSITWISTNNVSRLLLITDLVIGESDTPEVFSATLVDQVLTEIQNDWEFNGATLIESL